jgi:hypothetical protein
MPDPAQFVLEFPADDKLKARLETIYKDTAGRLRKGLLMYLIYLSSYIKTNKLTGQVLKVQTGRLRGSIRHRVDGGDLSGSIRVGTVYGLAWEYGFTTKSYVIEPRFKKALAFTVGGQRLVRRRVTMPARYQEERPYARTAYAETTDERKRLIVDRVFRGDAA